MSSNGLSRQPFFTTQFTLTEITLISIITDSTCDIPEDLIAQYGIVVIPHIIIWGNDQYRDRVDMQPEAFYQRLALDPQRPTSSQADFLSFQKAYELAASQGAQELIVLTVSSAMSGAYQMALNAAKSAAIPVHVVDSKGPTMSLGWQVLAAARARDAGSHLDQVRKKLTQIVCLETLEYMQKGGRLGLAAKWVGGLLHVKPLVSINHQTGMVEPVGLARTHRSAVEMMYNQFFASMNGGKNLRVAILHGNAKEKAEELAGRILTQFNPIELLINITGPVLGMNTGPGALALCGYAED